MRCILGSLSAFVLIAPHLAFGSELTNSQCSLTRQPDHSVEVKVGDIPTQRLAAEFTVMFSESDPGFSMNRVGRFDRVLPPPFPSLPVFAQRWAFHADAPATPSHELDALGMKGEIAVAVNSRGERLFCHRDSSGNAVEKKADLGLKGTANPYPARQRTVPQAVASPLDGDMIAWRFMEQPNVSLSAKVVLPPKLGDPRIRYPLKVPKAGFYLVAFTDMPWTDTAEILPVPQETLGSK